MEWLFGVLVGWAGKHVKAFVEALLRFGWLLWRLTPQQRCYVLLSIYMRFGEDALRVKQQNGPGGERYIKLVRRLDLWLYPKLVAWQRRVRPGI